MRNGPNVSHAHRTYFFPLGKGGEGCFSYLSAGDDEFHLAARGADDLGKLVGDALEEAEAVVRGQGGEEVLDRLVGSAAQGLLQLGHDGALVGLIQRGRRQDGSQLGILSVQAVDGVQRPGRGLEGGRLHGRRVLDCVVKKITHALARQGFPLRMPHSSFFFLPASSSPSCTSPA